MRLKRREIKYCECGCGKIVKKDKRFIHYHNLGRAHSLKTWENNFVRKEKLSQRMKKLWESKEWEEKMSKVNKTLDARKNHSLATKKVWECPIKGQIMRDTRNTLQARTRNSIAQKEAQNRPEVKEKKSKKLTVVMNTPEVRRRNSEARKRNYENQEYAAKMKLVHKISHNTPEFKEKIKKIHNSLKVRENHSMAGRKLWKDTKFVEKMIKGMAIKPNKPEAHLLGLLDRIYPNEWKYTGDFTFMINGKNPDFVNCNGQKKCIELFGDYWHKGDNPQERIDLFVPFGYKTLVIWESELRNMSRVEFKLRKFNRL